MTGRGLRGRRIARLMLVVAIGLDASVAVLFLNVPHTIGPMQFGPPSVMEWLIPAAGVIANVIGLAWMVRIYRASSAVSVSLWRFHRS